MAQPDSNPPTTVRLRFATTSDASPTAALGRLAFRRRRRREGVRTPRDDAETHSSLRPRRVLILVLIAALALAAVYVFWLRDSALVAVERTEVTGLSSERAAEIQNALAEAATGMTTLHVDTAELREVASSYPEVAAIEIDPDIPTVLEVEVTERRPVATVAGPDDELVPVAADGTLVPTLGTPAELARLPQPQADATGALADERNQTALAVVTAAPTELAERIELVEQREGALVAEIAGGPAIVLGDESRLEAKWLAASAVLAEGAAASASYVDVALPERPAAGG